MYYLYMLLFNLETLYYKVNKKELEKYQNIN